MLALKPEAFLQENPQPEIALSHIYGRGRRDFKLFSVYQDGAVWRWRVSYPYAPGRCPMVSQAAFLTRLEAEQSALAVSHYERPSQVLIGAFENVPANWGQPAEQREDWVGA